MNKTTIEYIKTNNVLNTNLFAYCQNNGITNIDENGCFALWALAIAIIAVSAVVGGILGATSSVKIGTNMEIANPNLNKHNGELDNEDEETESTELTFGDRVLNTVKGALLGACVGCVVDICLGAVLCFTPIAPLGYVTFCAGVAFGMIAATLLTAFGIQIDMPSFDPKEAESSVPKIPSGQEQYKHPGYE